jgi:hypothetical protein
VKPLETTSRPVLPLHDRVPLATFHAGFEAAVHRFHEASASRDPLDVFPPLFEALNWAVVIDDRISAHWKARRHGPMTKDSSSWSDGYTFGDTAKGVRFARHRVHHQWADALWLSEGSNRGMGAVRSRGHEWRWRPLSQLPKGSQGNEFAAEYDDKLCGAPARETLFQLTDCFSVALADLSPS